MATIKDAFTRKFQMNTNTEIEEFNFSPGDEVTVIEQWTDDTCLIKNSEGVVFNVPKKNVNL